MKSLYINTIIILCVFFVRGQETYKISDLDKKYLDSVFTQYMYDIKVPELAVGILKNKKVLYSKEFGIKDKNTKEPVTLKPLFHMVSVSKTLVPETSFAFILIENGDFTPNDFKLMEVAHGIASKH